MVDCERCEDNGKNVRVSFCPKCKSRSVKYVFRLGNLFGVIPKMRCGGCGFENPSFPVLVVSEEKLKETVKGLKKKKVRRKKK